MGIFDFFKNDDGFKERHKFNSKRNKITYFNSASGYSDSTKIRSEESYEHNIRNGLTKYFYKNGQLERQQNYKNGRREVIKMIQEEIDRLKF